MAFSPGMAQRVTRPVSGFRVWAIQSATAASVSAVSMNGRNSGLRAITPMLVWSPLSPLRAQASFTRGTVVSVALVSNVNGYCADITSLSKLAHDNGAYLYADIMQAAGGVDVVVARPPAVLGRVDPALELELELLRTFFRNRQLPGAGEELRAA